MVATVSQSQPFAHILMWTVGDISVFKVALLCVIFTIITLYAILWYDWLCYNNAELLFVLKNTIMSFVSKTLTINDLVITGLNISSRAYPIAWLTRASKNASLASGFGEHCYILNHILFVLKISNIVSWASKKIGDMSSPEPLTHEAIIWYAFVISLMSGLHVFLTFLTVIISLNTCTVQCCYNVVNFLTNIHKRHPIPSPLGWGMGCLLWIQHLIDILLQFL